jgi:RNA polymerase sigma-70 factor, ECF subfamily
MDADNARSSQVMSKATESIWQEFAKRLRSFIAKRISNQADTEDILQEVFLRVHRRLDTIQQVQRLPAWIFQITRNAIVDHHRTTSRRRQVFEEDVEAISVPEPAEENRDTREAEREIADCLLPLMNLLPREYRDAILLTEVEGRTQRETAELTGLSHSGMKARVQRGRKKLKDLLLDCCAVEQDRRGGIIRYENRRGLCCPDDSGSAKTTSSSNSTPGATRR